MVRVSRCSALKRSYLEFALSVPEDFSSDFELTCKKFTKFLPDFIHQKTLPHSTGRGWKCQIKVLVEFEKYNWDREEMVYTDAWFLGNIFAVIVSDPKSIEDCVRSSFTKICSSFDLFVHKGSGWKLKVLKTVEIKLFRFKLFSGGGKDVALPKDIARRRACISVSNIPADECFYYAVAAGILRVEKNPQRSMNYIHIVDVLKSKRKSNGPTDMAEVKRFERQSNISVNIFAYTDGLIHPLHITVRKQKPFHVNLLLCRNHYFTIRNMSALVCKQVRSNRTRMFICPYCLCYYVRREKFDRHMMLCKKGLQVFDMFKHNEIAFSDFTKLVEVPFVIYFDLESICTPLEKDDKCVGHVKARGRHVPIAVSAIRICRANSQYSSARPFLYTGLDCIEKFFEYLKRQSYEIYKIVKDEYHPLRMKPKDEKSFDLATECAFCKLKFHSEVKKCRDHCHLSGRYRAALCDTCNLNRAKQRPGKIAVFSHGLTNYDSHFILSQAHKFGDGNVFAMPRTEEKMCTFSMGRFDFKDSFSFMETSLSELASLLREKGIDKFHNMKRYLPEEKTMHMMLRKGVFPYSYMDNEQRLKDTELPPKEAFYNDLTQSHIGDAEYSFARFVWDEMECRTFQDYMETYLATDVMLLADVFENFRTNCMNDYELDPAHYISSAQYTFDAFLRYSRCRLDSFRDVDHYLYTQSALRGGVSQISHRLSFANNKYLTKYDPSAPSKYILYMDLVNLYGYAMTQLLPVGGLRWMSSEELSLENILSLPEFGAEGCFVSVTLSYPKHLHDLHSDLPLAPKHDKIPLKSISKYSRDVVTKHNLANSSVNKTKLMTTFFTKENYTVHYRLLQFYARQGLKIEKIHSGLAFRQEAVMKDYIELNSKRRAQSTNEFDSNFYKLLSNALYGKTIERIDKRVTARIVSNISKFQCLTSKPLFKSGTRINENLMSVILNQAKITLNKPSYLGPAVLDLAKLSLYDFHLCKIKKFYGNKAKLLFTDTDSLMYEIQTEDVYADLRQMDDGKTFDFSNYPENHPNHCSLYKKIPGRWKDETGGTPIAKFIGLRSKMYCYVTENEDGTLSTNKRAKGIPKAVVQRNIDFARFEKILREDGKDSDMFRCIRSEKHAVYTKEVEKSTLCAFDDKRYLLDSVNSLPHGHYSIHCNNGENDL